MTATSAAVTTTETTDSGPIATTRIKICGVTQPDDAARVAAAGADLLGLNFWPRSKRYLPPARAAEVAAAARAAAPGVVLVGVFVNAAPAEIAALAGVLDVIQLHGDETPDDARAVAAATGRAVWKAVAAAAPRDVEDLAVWPVDAILLDAPAPGRGGSGQMFDWNLARQARRRDPARRLVLAGGLAPGNVAAAIEAVRPWAVDVASGVEADPGVKDPDKVAAFVAAVREACVAGAPRTVVPDKP